MTKKLKPYPFCGGSGQVRYDYGSGQVRYDYGDLRGEYSGYYVQCSNSYCIAYNLFAPLHEKG